MAKNHMLPSSRAQRVAVHAALEHHLLNDAGRDLWRPLWTIMGAAQLLLRSRDLSPRDARLAERIDSAAHHLARVARDLLDEALAETGNFMPLTPVSTHMRALAQEALIEARLGNPNRWITQEGSGDGSAEWDCDRVLQLLSSLLTHALEYSSEHSPVTFAWWGEVAQIVVEIRYEPVRSGGDPGWTLGLSVAREIARAHGGDLTVRNAASGRFLAAVLPRTVPLSAQRPRDEQDTDPVTGDGVA